MKNATESKIEIEILEKVTVRAWGKREAIENYIARLVRATANTEDEIWDSLSEETKAWVNRGIKSINTGTTIAMFPDIKEKQEKKKPVKKEKSKLRQVRETIIKNIDKSKNDIIKIGVEKGLNMSHHTWDSQYYIIKGAYNIMVELDMIKQSKTKE